IYSFIQLGLNGLLPPPLRVSLRPFILDGLFACWMGFAWALGRGRRPEFYHSRLAEIIIGGILGLVLGIVMFFVFGGSMPGVDNFGDGVLWVLFLLLLIIWGFLWGGLAAMFSHVFTNDNQLDSSFIWQTGYHLPFAG